MALWINNILCIIIGLLVPVLFAGLCIRRADVEKNPSTPKSEGLWIAGVAATVIVAITILLYIYPPCP